MCFFLASVAEQVSYVTLCYPLPAFPEIMASFSLINRTLKGGKDSENIMLQILRTPDTQILRNVLEIIQILRNRKRLETATAKYRTYGIFELESHLH